LRGGASVLTSLVHADALLAIPASRDAVGAGAEVQVELLRPMAQSEGALLLAGVPDRALDLLALAFGDGDGDGGRGAARVAFCEMAPEEAVALVRAGMCHAAAIAVSAGLPRLDDGGELVALRLAESEVVLAVGANRPCPTSPNDLLRPGTRVVVGPHATPARRVLDEVLTKAGPGAWDIIEVRSDAAALATVAAGRADCAASTLAAARRAGFTTIPLGRAALDLVIHRARSDGDPAVRALLETLRSPSLAAVLETAGYDVRGIAR
jgi:putative molybdopterin biosynthesis protein